MGELRLRRYANDDKQTAPGSARDWANRRAVRAANSSRYGDTRQEQARSGDQGRR